MLGNKHDQTWMAGVMRMGRVRYLMNGSKRPSHVSGSLLLVVDGKSMAGWVGTEGFFGE